MSLTKPNLCDCCPRAHTGTGFVMGVGPKDARLMIIGEEPGINEVHQGVPFVGKSGDRVNKALESFGRDNAYITNVRKCLGPAKETPQEREASIRFCTETYLQKELDQQTETRAVICIGSDASETIVGMKHVTFAHGCVWTREEADACRGVHEANIRLVDVEGGAAPGSPDGSGTQGPSD